jgi:hypothetical protein
MLIPTDVMVTRDILSRVKRPIALTEVSVIYGTEPETSIDETKPQLLQRLQTLERLAYTQKQRGSLYLLHLAGPTGVVLLILGSVISAIGWAQGLVSVGLAGLAPWAVVLTDVLTRSHRKL